MGTILAVWFISSSVQSCVSISLRKTGQLERDTRHVEDEVEDQSVDENELRNQDEIDAENQNDSAEEVPMREPSETSQRCIKNKATLCPKAETLFQLFSVIIRYQVL